MAPRKQRQKNNPKMDKLEAFLADFDSEVETVIERLKERTNSMLKDVDNLYNMALIKLPKAERQMNWLQHCNFYGAEKPKAPVEDDKIKAEAAKVQSVMAEVHTIPAKKSLKKQGEAGSSSEVDENSQTTVKKGKSRKPPMASKRAKALSVNARNSSIRKSNRKPLVTPARGIMDSCLMTPLITPRFDPRLPKTPAVRVPRHKERVYSISVNGSPIAGQGEDIVINVPVGNGESIQLLASQMDSVDLSQLDETALRSIRLLQTRLTTLCGTSE